MESNPEACDIQGQCVTTYLRERIATMSPNARAAVGSKFIESIEKACVLLGRQDLTIKAIQAANGMFVEHEKRVEAQLKALRGKRDPVKYPWQIHLCKATKEEYIRALRPLLPHELVAQLKAKGEAIRSYTSHKEDCHLMYDPPDHPEGRCTCGLEQALEGSG